VLATRLMRLMQLLAIDPVKPVGVLSDGAMRRVQIALKLLRPASVLLVDEVTADLDVLARQALLSFLREEAEEGCAVIYCTHIMDGLDGWASHLLHVRPWGHTGKLLAADELLKPGSSDGALSNVVKSLLQEDSSLSRPVKQSTLSKAAEEIELPTGWKYRQSTQSGAYGNYAWDKEQQSEENWSFKSVAPPPQKPQGAPGAPGMASMPGMPAAPGMMPGTLGMPAAPGMIPGMPAVPGMAGSPGLLGMAGMPSMPGMASTVQTGEMCGTSGAVANVEPSSGYSQTVEPSMSNRTTQVEADSNPFGHGTRLNQLTHEQLLNHGILRG